VVQQLTWDAIQSNAIAFSKKWQKAKNEEAEAQGFQLDFLRIFGVDEPMAVGDFEYRVPLAGGRTGYIDYVWKSKIAIEMKSRGKSLDEAFTQLQNYMQNLPTDEIPDLWMVCDFENIRLCRRSTNEIWNFKTKDLRKHIKRFADIAGYETERDKGEQIEVNVKAAEKMAKLYDALRDHGYEGQELEVYLVRLLFCLFADDTGIFPKDSLYNYFERSKADGSDLTHRIADLFEVLNMSEDIRAKKSLLSDELKQFRYINGKLFADRLPPADFNAKMRQTLLECLNFNWNKISPAIFGAMFQGVMNKSKRREMGAHYTSEENIEKLINPLFMDELWKDFDKVKTDPAALDRFHDKISRLKFLDPACGCGNFLIVTYGKLRELELEILKMKAGTNQLIIDITPMLKVSVEQFYGIELEEFACQIAQVGMWLIDHQMNLRVSEQFGMYFARLPLSQGAVIVHGNALRLDWESIVSKHELSYILGNPPFVGLSLRNTQQQEDMDIVFKYNERAGRLDYVAAWYKKASNFVRNTFIEVAFVSTNSITQGEQVPILWSGMKESESEINFAHRTFIWSNEAKGKAAVHCVIIGFSQRNHKVKRLFEYDYEGELVVHEVKHINGYLVAAENVFVELRGKARVGFPKLVQGSKPWDGGFLILSEEERQELLRKYPETSAFIKQYVGSQEFINSTKRYCLWLQNVPPTAYRNIPDIMERLDGVRKIRRKTKTVAVQKQADIPMLFSQIRQPTTNYLLVPETSSENRRYIPIGFMPPDIIASNATLVAENATLYHFGILTSNVHMAWTRTVCGRLKSDYRYSPSIYNNFPWPEANNKHQAEIEKLAQSILGARASYPESSLADLYDPLTMPPDLLKAHQNLDRAVMKLYGFPVKNFTEADCVGALMGLYRELIDRGE